VKDEERIKFHLHLKLKDGGPVVVRTRSECAQGPAAFEVERWWPGRREGRGANALKVHLHLKLKDSGPVVVKDEERVRSRSTTQERQA
jgi:hypothetical protein